MTPEEAEAFRAALENLLREHKVWISANTDETISISPEDSRGREICVRLTETRGFFDIECETRVRQPKPEPLPSQEPGRISPDTPF